MKKILWFIAIILGCSPCFAVTNVYEVALSSITMQLVNVSTSVAAPGATQMDNPQVPNRATVEIQNIDASANLWCLAVSTTPTVNGARKIAAGNSWIISISNSLVQRTNALNTTASLWCLSDGAAATKAIVTQLY